MQESELQTITGTIQRLGNTRTGNEPNQILFVKLAESPVVFRKNVSPNPDNLDEKIAITKPGDQVTITHKKGFKNILNFQNEICR